MNIRKKETKDFINAVHEIFTICNFDGRKSKLHLTQETATLVRLTFYYGEKPITKRVTVKSKISLKKLAKIVIKEYPNVFRHIKNRTDYLGNKAFTIY